MMKGVTILYLGALVLMAAGLQACGKRATPIEGVTGKVVKVIDGNTLELDNGLKVHVLGVEDNSQTKSYMTGNVLDRRVSLRPDNTSTKPKTYKKALSEVWAYVKVNDEGKITPLAGYMIKTRLTPFNRDYVSDSLEAYANYASYSHPNQRMNLATLKSKMQPATFMISTVDSNGREGIGTGFFITPDGLALTNNHVLGGNERAIVLLANADGHIDINRQRSIYRLLGTHPELDFTVFQVQLDPGEKVPYLHLSYQQAVVPDEVGVVGNPRGYDAVFTSGHITQVYDEAGRVQFDANIAPGNSGGPISNMFGEVVGIAQSVAADANGQISTGNLNFGVDIMKVRPYLDSHSDIPTYAGK